MSLIHTFGKTDIIIPADAKTVSALKQVAKILTDTEGQTTKDKVDEIFQIFFDIEKVRTGLTDFFRKETAPMGDILTERVEAGGLLDVIDMQHGNAQWCFAIRAARVPTKFYNSVTPDVACRQAGETIGKALVRGKEELLFVYGDSRVYGGPSNTGPKFTNLAYIFGYKQKHNRYT